MEEKEFYLWVSLSVEIFTFKGIFLLSSTRNSAYRFSDDFKKLVSTAKCRSIKYVCFFEMCSHIYMTKKIPFLQSREKKSCYWYVKILG